MLFSISDKEESIVVLKPKLNICIHSGINVLYEENPAGSATYLLLEIWRPSLLSHILSCSRRWKSLLLTSVKGRRAFLEKAAIAKLW